MLKTGTPRARFGVQPQRTIVLVGETFSTRYRPTQVHAIIYVYVFTVHDQIPSVGVTV